MNEEVNVICMKWGTVFSSQYVNKLYNMVSKNLTRKFNFVCFTEDSTGVDSNVIIKPLPEIYVPIKNQYSPWRKLSMFAKNVGGLKGKTLFLDLDVVIIDNIDCFFDYSDQFAIIENWTQMGRGIGNSSVYCFEIGKYSSVFDDYIINADKIVNEYDNEQIYLSKHIDKELVFWPQEWCRSFKRHCVKGRVLRFFLVPQIPSYVKIICFHGHPRPHEAMQGIWPKKLIPYLKAPQWLKKYWI